MNRVLQKLRLCLRKALVAGVFFLLWLRITFAPIEVPRAPLDPPPEHIRYLEPPQWPSAAPGKGERWPYTAHILPLPPEVPSAPVPQENPVPWSAQRRLSAGHPAAAQPYRPPAGRPPARRERPAAPRNPQRGKRARDAGRTPGVLLVVLVIIWNAVQAIYIVIILGPVT